MERLVSRYYMSSEAISHCADVLFLPRLLGCRRISFFFFFFSVEFIID